MRRPNCFMTTVISSQTPASFRQSRFSCKMQRVTLTQHVLAVLLSLTNSWSPQRLMSINGWQKTCQPSIKFTIGRERSMRIPKNGCSLQNVLLRTVEVTALFNSKN